VDPGLDPVSDPDLDPDSDPDSDPGFNPGFRLADVRKSSTRVRLSSHRLGSCTGQLPRLVPWTHRTFQPELA
jgi:hypothetical protein